MSERRPSVLDRFLRLFAPVSAGEGATVLVMALNIFVLMTAYYLIKPVREALILATGGAEIKTYASTGQALVLLGVVPLYSRLASVLPRRRLIATVLLFFAANLVVFYVLAQARVPLGVPFYLWVGIFNFMVVAQFWSFANDVYTPDEGKRLFAIVGFGMSAGAVSGSFIAGRLIGPLGTYQLMLLSAAMLAVSLILTAVVDGWRAARAPAPDVPGGPVEHDLRDGPALPDEPADAPEDMSGPNGFVLLLRSRYLLLIAAMMILANLVNTTGEYVLGARVKAAQEAAVAQVVRTPGQTEAAYEAAVNERVDRVGARIGRFYADFFSVVNLAGLLIQLFLVARIVKWIGVRWALLILPLVAMGGYGLMALLPAMGVVRWAKTAENATDYSLQNTVRNMLFLPTTRQEKYKAKQAIDTFCVRVGDVAAALLVFAGTTWVKLSPGGFAGVNVVLAGLWVVVAVAIGRRFVRLSAADTSV